MSIQLGVTSENDPHIRSSVYGRSTMSKPFDWRAVAIIMSIVSVALAIVLALTFAKVIPVGSSSSDDSTATKGLNSQASPQDAIIQCPSSSSTGIVLSSSPTGVVLSSSSTAAPISSSTAAASLSPDPSSSPSSTAPSVSSASTTVLAGRHLYVAPSGAQYTTILAASNAAIPGDTIHVAPGTYLGGFKTTKHGTETQHIRYQSDVLWGAKIVPPNTTTGDTIWQNQGNWTEIYGFHVDGTGSQPNWANGLYLGGSHSTIQRCYVHHIGNNAPLADSAGGAGVAADSYYGGIDNHLLDNIVHDLGPKTGKFIQGVYMSTTGSVRNNLVYNVQNWCIHLWHNAHNVLVQNNTAYNCFTGGGFVIGGGDFYNGYTAGADNCIVTNNVAFGSPYGIVENGVTGKNNSYLYNRVFDNQINWQLIAPSTHTEA